MTDAKSIRKQVCCFLKDNKKKKAEIDIPKDFKPDSLVNPLLLCYRKAVLFLQKWIIPCRLKNWLLSTTGIRIGLDACIPHYIHFDPYFPELISIGRGSLVGGLSSFHTHKIKDRKLLLGRIDVKERALIAGLTTIFPGVTVNKHAITGMKSTITNDVPERGFVVGRDKLLKIWSDEEVERHFGESKHDPAYYKEYRQKTREFRKNQGIMRVTIRNNGRRLNPGNEWYLARPWIRIFYNAAFVETARIAPWEWLRKLLYTCMGVRLGRNVKLGKGTVFDHIYGDMCAVGDNVKIGKNCYFDNHSYTLAESDYGRIVIGENTIIEDNCYVFCGARIGRGCTLKNGAAVLRDVPDGETWAGMPAKPVELKKDK